MKDFEAWSCCQKSPDVIESTELEAREALGKNTLSDSGLDSFSGVVEDSARGEQEFSAVVEDSARGEQEFNAVVEDSVRGEQEFSAVVEDSVRVEEDSETQLVGREALASVPKTLAVDSAKAYERILDQIFFGEGEEERRESRWEGGGPRVAPWEPRPPSPGGSPPGQPRGDKAVQTDTWQVSPEAGEDLKKSADFLKSVLRLKRILKTRKELTSEQFSDILRNISPKSSTSAEVLVSLSQRSDTDFRFSPQWLKKRPRKAARWSGAPRTVQERNQDYINKIRELYPALQPDTISETPPQRSIVFNPKRKLDFVPREPKEAKEGGRVSCETLGYALRASKVDLLAQQAVDSVLGLLEREVTRGVVDLALGWRGSALQHAVAVLAGVADLDPFGLRKQVRAMVFRLVTGCFTDCFELTKLECKAQIVAEFGQSSYLAFDIVHEIVLRLSAVKSAVEDLSHCRQWRETPQRATLDSVERCQVAGGLLLGLLTGLRARFQARGGARGLERDAERRAGVLQAWRRNWRTAGSCAGSAEPAPHYPAMVRDWGDRLDECLVTALEPLPILATVIMECRQVVKDLITIM